MKKIFRTIGIVLIILLVAAVVGAVVWLQPYHADAVAEAAMQSSESVTVTSANDIIAFMPKSSVKAGFIFYPGALVVPEAYAVKMHAIAERGYAVFIVKMPLNLAILGLNRADEVIAAHPEIDQWALGGHSLGGAMACNYLANAPDSPIHTLVFYAAYCDKSFSLAERNDMHVVSIAGSKDGLATPQKVADAKPYAPASATYITIEGGNHADFGNYGGQNGDGAATITNEDATTQIVEITVKALDSLVVD